jgi:hypothetical protein
VYKRQDVRNHPNKHRLTEHDFPRMPQSHVDEQNFHAWV